MRPAEGLFAAPRRLDAIADLFANVWQLGYVTTDLERAIEFMGERFGLGALPEPAGAGDAPSSSATSPRSGRRASRWARAAG